MYFNFSTQFSLPFGRGDVLDDYATLGLEATAEEVDIPLSSFSSHLALIPVYTQPEITVDEYKELMKIAEEKDVSVVIVVDDFSYFNELVSDTKSQNPTEKVEGFFSVLNNITIFGYIDQKILLLFIEEH